MSDPVLPFSSTATPLQGSVEPLATPFPVTRYALRVLLGLVLLGGGVTLLSHHYHAELEQFGLFFLHRFGLMGVFLGVFIADAFSCPVPPIFYLFTAVTSGEPQAPAVIITSVSSIAAGTLGYFMARRLGRFGWFRHWLERTRPRVDPILHRHGLWAAIVANIVPFPFSVLCYLAGFYRMSRGAFTLFLGGRVIRILVMYFVVLLGWHA